MKKQKEFTKLYRNEMLKIYNIIIDDNIVDKKFEIEKIGEMKKLDESLKYGLYLGIEKELTVIKDWYEIYKKQDEEKKDEEKKSNDRRYRTKNILRETKIFDLVYLNNLYENNLLNLNTYYPIFKKLNLSCVSEPLKFNCLLSDKVSLENEITKKAIENMEKIEKEIEIFHSGINLKNLKYRRLIEETLEQSNYLENYNYAEFLLKSYINCKSCYRINDFIYYLNIKEDIFKECVYIIKFLNPILYEEYLIKRKEDETKNIIACKLQFQSLAEEISNYFKDKKEMPKFDYLMKSPFLSFHENQSIRDLRYAAKVNNFIDDQDVLNILNAYIYKNKLNLITLISTEKYLKEIETFNGIELKYEDRKNILEIMKLLRIVSTSCTIEMVITYYLKGFYDLDSIRKTVEEKRSSMEKVIGKNPYEYKISKK